jgi:hypothetical protein
MDCQKFNVLEKKTPCCDSTELRKIIANNSSRGFTMSTQNAADSAVSKEFIKQIINSVVEWAARLRQNWTSPVCK